MKNQHRARATWACVLVLAACGGGSDAPSDAMSLSPDGGGSDVAAGGNGGARVLDGSVDNAVVPADGPPAGPSAPTLSSPTSQFKSAGVLDVTGVADPGADVLVKLTLGPEVLVARTLVAGTDGTFSVNLTYRGVAHQQNVIADVRQVTAKGASPAARVTVVHDVPYSITGTLNQSAGTALKGTKVIVRLYRNADIEHVLDYVAEQVVNVAADNPVTAAFSLSAAAGPYWVRAFRDSFGPDGGAPDGQPSFGFDAQTTATVSVVNPVTNTANLLLVAPASSADRYEGFNAMYNNVSPQPVPPSMRQGDKRLVGKGLCLGFFLDSYVSRVGQPSAVSKPWLRLPSGRIVDMKDDGACSETVRDNSASSFDDAAGDNKYRFGVADPDERSEGVFAFFYRHESSGHIHIQTDELKAKIKMPLLREITSPDGSTTVKTRTPKITWAAVPNAKLYQARLRALTGTWDNGDKLTSFVTVPEYTPTEPLNDDTCYQLTISALDGNPFNQDVDAVAYAHSHHFCVDVNGANTIEITGSITNKTSQNYPMSVTFSSKNHEVAASVRLPANATTYKVAMLADAANDDGALRAFIDRAGSGLDSSLENQGYEVNRDNLKLGANLALPIVFNPRVAALTPSWFADATTKPKFTWEDYAITAGSNKPAGPFAYAVWVGAEVTGSQPLIYAVPSTTTSLDMANLPAASQSLDVQAFASCVEGGGTFSTNAQGAPVCAGATITPSLKQLAPSSLYVWAVIVVECNFAGLVHPAKSAPEAEANPFVACLQKAMAGSQTFAQSAETPFFVK